MKGKPAPIGGVSLVSLKIIAPGQEIEVSGRVIEFKLDTETYILPGVSGKPFARNGQRIATLKFVVDEPPAQKPKARKAAGRGRKKAEG